MIVYLNTETSVEYVDATPKTVKNIDVLVQGVIYNYRTVIDAYAAGGNIETAIVNMYTKHGFRHVMFMLEGEFSVVLYDRVQNEVYVARDPYGICFLYLIPPILGSTTWIITDKNTMVKPLTIGTYSSLSTNEDGGVWRLMESEERYHSIPLYSNRVSKPKMSLTTLSFHYFQYLKHAIQKRILPNKSYYINYDASKDILCFMLAWIVFQLYPSLDFSIYVNDYSELSAQWHEVFGERIRMYSLNYDNGSNTVEISPEDVLIVNSTVEDESELFFELRKRLELYNGLPHKVGPIKCIRPFMDAALIDFYLTEVPTEMRMSNALFLGDQSIISFLPQLFTRV